MYHLCNLPIAPANLTIQSVSCFHPSCKDDSPNAVTDVI